MKIKSSALAILLAASCACAIITSAQQRPRSLFYLTRNPDSVRSFLDHADKVDTLVPAWYYVDANGLVSGGANPEVLETARQHKVELMPIVANPEFVQDDIHKLLSNPVAFRAMLDQLLAACDENHYSGFQFDFEDVNWTDRDVLSTRVAEAAALFHQHHLKLTIATVPNAPGHAGESGYSAWIFENWRAAYDLAALAKSVDLICLMTYDQHTRWTPPGPVAGWKWTQENLDYALKSVPPEKLSLGIPLYGYHWFAGTPTKPGDKPNPTAMYISTPDALDLARAYNAKQEWDEFDHSPWLYFYRDDQREWIYFTDARSFKDRYDLAQSKGLQGFCSWVLGTEDPKIWEFLPSH